MAEPEKKAELKAPAPSHLKLWREAKAVCFDVDSTVCLEEGVDVLADFLGCGEKVAEMTTNAMNGNVKFEDALAARLNLMNVSRSQLEQFLQANPPRLSPGIPELVRELQERGIDVFLVSGGFRQLIYPIAETLGIPRSNVFANTILFNDDGSYASFDAEEPTSRSGGKPVALDRIRKSKGYETMVMVGDGVTDLEARQAGSADMFIGYGGVKVRPAVVEGSDWFVCSFQILRDALKETA